MREPRHGAAPWIKVDALPQLLRDREMPPVVFTNLVPIASIERGAAERLDPRMFIRRHSLRCKLPADPVRLLRHHHPHPVATRRDCRRTPAHPAANHCHVTLQFPGMEQRRRNQLKECTASECPHARAIRSRKKSSGMYWIVTTSCRPRLRQLSARPPRSRTASQRSALASVWKSYRRGVNL